VCHGFGASAVQAGALLTLFFAWNVMRSVSLMFKELEAKQSIIMKRHTHFLINNWGFAFRIFRNGWFDCRDAFHVVLCL